MFETKKFDCLLNIVNKFMYTVHEVKCKMHPPRKEFVFLDFENQISIKRPPQLRDHFSSFP